MIWFHKQEQYKNLPKLDSDRQNPSNDDTSTTIKSNLFKQQKQIFKNKHTKVKSPAEKMKSKGKVRSSDSEDEPSK